MEHNPSTSMSSDPSNELFLAEKVWFIILVHGLPILGLSLHGFKRTTTNERSPSLHRYILFRHENGNK